MQQWRRNREDTACDTDEDEDKRPGMRLQEAKVKDIYSNVYLYRTAYIIRSACPLSAYPNLLKGKPPAALADVYACHVDL